MKYNKIFLLSKTILAYISFIFSILYFTSIPTHGQVVGDGDYGFCKSMIFINGKVTYAVSSIVEIPPGDNSDIGARQTTIRNFLASRANSELSSKQRVSGENWICYWGNWGTTARAEEDRKITLGESNVLDLSLSVQNPQNSLLGSNRPVAKPGSPRLSKTSPSSAQRSSGTPIHPDGNPCITVKAIESRRDPVLKSQPQYAFSCDGEGCYDVIVRFNVTNRCSSKIFFSADFPRTDGRRPLGKGDVIQGGQSKIFSCYKKLDACSGELSFSSKFQ